MKLALADSPTRIIQGDIDYLYELASTKCSILIITSIGFRKRGIVDSIILNFSEKKINVIDDVHPNPTIDFVNQLISKYRNHKYDCIIAIGGGSVMDVAKIMRLALSNKKMYTLRSGDINLVTATANRNKKILLIGVPTTSGSGAEVTPFSTIWDGVEKKKYSWSSDLLRPDIALLNPDLVLTLPKDQTLYSALDALSHSLESIWNHNSTEISRTYAIESIKIFSDYFLSTINDLHSTKNRKKMQLASTMAGLAISITKTAIAHSISYPLTAKLGIPHGLAASFTLHKILEDHQSIISKNDEEYKLFSKILIILKNLNLKVEIKKFSAIGEILSLSNEMQNKDRFKNFNGKNYDIKALLTASLSS